MPPLTRREYLQMLLLGGLSSNAYANPARPVANKKEPYRLLGQTLEGKPWSLQAQRNQFTLITFWATWCPTCRKELPLLRSFYEDNQRKGFNLLAISLDERREDVAAYQQVLFQVIPASQRFPIMWRKEWGHQDTFGPITGTPSHFMFRKDGSLFRFRQGALQPEDWDDFWTEMNS
ncbi:TlpA family protein disulfide reductase [Parvibium lacunae]|uniref:TlpA family protein disulfide reductase n=1 Tax=Parvibium lacunae TaxID=1888893 RepID=A0A368L4C0_9BURK|nr:TlpA disulfide reductase family protein [Parvibium lacunae]RCS58419.1 TlpA family protein disulfide reductase [Parvibium lacunae]